ncbi:hypothetical protein ANN_02689 [Periplaneta americana]|uniref:Uncharacterized protein n=1 Tax=Periplaneta americana TaxID=6978 RepID=A0ABQ8TWZ7_PERAM|nr:hypothetical protein ANN_02689 [Periplaneta americana]
MQRRLWPLGSRGDRRKRGARGGGVDATKGEGEQASQSCVAVKPALRPKFDLSCVRNCGSGSPEFECSEPQLGELSSKFSGLSLKSLMLVGNEFQSLGRAIVKEDEYEEVRWDGIVSIVSWRERVFRLWWEESTSCAQVRLSLSTSPVSEHLLPVQLRMVPPKDTSRQQSANHSCQSCCPTRTLRFWGVSLSTVSSHWHLLSVRLRVVPPTKYKSPQQSANHNCRLSHPEAKAGRLKPGVGEVLTTDESSRGGWRLDVLSLTRFEPESRLSRPLLAPPADSRPTPLFLQSEEAKMGGHVARMGESRNADRVLVGRPEEKIPLGRLRRRWEDNIKMDLREVGYDDRDWINLAQDRDQWWAYVRTAMNLLKSQPTIGMYAYVNPTLTGRLFLDSSPDTWPHIQMRPSASGLEQQALGTIVDR